MWCVVEGKEDGKSTDSMDVFESVVLTIPTEGGETENT